MAVKIPATDDAGLNMTPMIDIVFQLILFFLFNLRFKSLDYRIESTLPKDRGLAAVRRVLTAHPGARVCLVGHGDQIRLLLTAFLGLDAGEFRRLRIDTCGLSAVDLGSASTEVKFVNLLADPERVWEPLHWNA